MSPQRPDGTVWVTPNGGGPEFAIIAAFLLIVARCQGG